MDPTELSWALNLDGSPGPGGPLPGLRTQHCVPVFLSCTNDCVTAELSACSPLCLPLRLSEEPFTRAIYASSVVPGHTKNVWEEWTTVAELILRVSHVSWGESAAHWDTELAKPNSGPIDSWDVFIVASLH